MMTYRPYTPDDWKAICRVHDRSRPDELAGSCDPRAFVPLAEDPESLEIPEYRMIVACDGLKVVGFSGVRDQYIGWLYVDPDYYRRGIGRSLLRKVIEIAGGSVWTIALKGNSRALALYESEGFKVTKEFEGKNAGYSYEALKLSLGMDSAA